MPYLSESSLDPPRIFRVGRSTGAYYFVTLPNGRHRSQFGFRSTHLTKEEEAIVMARPSNHGTMLSHINLLDQTSGNVSDIGFRRHDMRFWPTNRRDYRETAYEPTGFIADLDIRPNPYKQPHNVMLHGAHGIVRTNLVLPDPPAEAEARSIAGRLLRESRPPVERLNLFRSVAEQKDAPLLLRMTNYIPRSPKHFGEAVLNFLFGLKPTGEDIGRAVELCLRTIDSTQALLESEDIQERRYNVHVMQNQSISGTASGSYNSTSSSGVEVNLAQKLIWKGFFLTYSGVPGNFGNVTNANLNWMYTVYQQIRTHATWEYFVPRPLELEKRLPAYRQAAENVLRTVKFDASVVYDLTPWTWLANWFVDIGGLLRYQEQILQNQQVMTNSGYTITSYIDAQVNYTGQTRKDYEGTGSYFKLHKLNHPSSVSRLRIKRVVREPCSPYSVGPTWDLSPQQWAILGALGLSRGPNQPNIR